MKSQILFKSLLTLGALALVATSLTGCGASKTGVAGSSDLASRNTPGTGDQNAVLLECTSLANNTSNIEARLTSYYHPTTNEYIPTIIRMKIDRLPVNVTTNSTTYIQLFKWFASDANQKSYSSTPVSFKILNRTTRQFVGETAMQTISKASIQNMITTNNLGSSVTLNNFFEKHLLILEGMDLTYDAVSFVVYDSTQGTKALATHDVLLPAFAANPAAYASTHPQSILQQIHPYWSDRGAGLSDSHFHTLSYDNCIP